MKTAVQFGGGNIGRGFLAQLFTQSGYEVVFVEVKPEIISDLNRNRQYILRIVGKNACELLIKNVSGVSALDAEKVVQQVCCADIVATAVGVSALPKIAPLIASGIESRAERKLQKPLNIIICENLLSAGEVLKGYIKSSISRDCYDYLDRYIGLVETVVSRMIPPVPEEMRKEDPLLVVAEEYSILPVSRQGFVGQIPEIKGMIPYDNLEAYEQRKLFVHNLGHAICAYAGYQKGYVYIWETVLDKDIISLVRAALDESGRALMKKYSFKDEDIYGHVDDLLERFGNKVLGDTVYRVGRDPVRKLGADDRLVGAAKLCLAFDIYPEHIVKGIVYGLNYDYEKDDQAKELRKLINAKGIDHVLQNVCGLGEEEKLASLIKEEFGGGEL